MIGVITNKGNIHQAVEHFVSIGLRNSEMLRSVLNETIFSLILLSMFLYLLN